MNRLIAPARSLGLKLVLVGALAFLLWIPCLMIYALVWERSTRAEGVRNEIHDLEGGRQTISGPIILVPAVIEAGHVSAQGAPITRRLTVAFTPTTLNVQASVNTSTRRRSIFDATVYDADIELEGRFGPFVPPRFPEGKASFAWNEAKLAVKFAGENSLKGVRDDPALSIDGARVAASFEPEIGLESADPNFTPASGVSLSLPNFDPAKGFRFALSLPMSGGGALQFSPVGEESSVAMTGDWPHPSFEGARLPDSRLVEDAAFSAEWRVPYLARGLPKSFVAEPGLAILDAGKSFGAAFVSTDSPYQAVNRALKYALMFVGIVFLTFFLIEATMAGRAHAAQYILLGLAQVVFYLLVLAFSEHIAFETAFFGAAGATVALSGLYAATVFRSLWRGLIALIAFAGAYGLIYLLMKSEDHALLIGSVAAFGAVALVMTVTRNLDWYGAHHQEGRA